MNKILTAHFKALRAIPKVALIFATSWLIGALVPNVALSSGLSFAAGYAIIGIHFRKNGGWRPEVSFRLPGWRRA